jgi:predicted PurR-regulated permease PerM
MKENVRITIASSTIIKTILWIAFFAGLFYVRDLIIALLVAVVLASAAEMPIRSLRKWGISRGLSVAVIFLVFIAIIAAIMAILVPPLADDAARFIRTLPQLLDSIHIFGKDIGLRDISSSLQAYSGEISGTQILTVVKETLFGAGSFFATTTAVLGSLVNIIIVFVMAFYLALQERGVEKFLKLIFPKSYEEYIVDVWDRSQRKIGFWMQGQLLLSCIMGILVFVPMLILGIPYAALLGLLAFGGELIPIVGMLFSVIPGLVLAYAHGGASLLGIVAIIFLVVHQMENHILVPRVMNKMVGVPSLIVIIAVLIGAKFAGIWGIILAVPLASIFMELVADFDKRKNAI